MIISEKSDEAANFIGVSVFIHSGLSLCLQPHRSRVYHATVPAMLNATGRKPHAPNCDVANIVRILLTLKIPSRKVSENHLYAYAVVAVQDDFSVLSDCFHD